MKKNDCVFVKEKETSTFPRCNFHIWQYLLVFCVVMPSAFQTRVNFAVCLWLVSYTCWPWWILFVPFCHSVIITATPIYSSSHSASGPGQSPRLYLSQTVALWRDWEALLDWMSICWWLLWPSVSCLLQVIVASGWQHLHATKVFAAISERVHIWCPMRYKCIKNYFAYILSNLTHFKRVVLKWGVRVTLPGGL